MKITGYADRFSVAPGETIRFMVSSDAPRYRADIVRLVHGDTNPEGPGFQEREIATKVSGEYAGRAQKIHPGSAAIVPEVPARGSFTFAAMIWPTMPERGEQIVAAQLPQAEGEDGWSIGIENGCLVLWLWARSEEDRSQVRGEWITQFKPLLSRHWYCIGASYDPETGEAQLWQRQVKSYPLADRSEISVIAVGKGALDARRAPVTFAAQFSGSGMLAQHFNGKIDSPRLHDRALSPDVADRAVRDSTEALRLPGLVAAWDFSRGMTGTQIHDLSRNARHGETVNLPARAMKGWNWTGAAMDWKSAPEQYGAIHFHEDDLYDAGWQEDFRLEVPHDLKSGIYAARLRSGDDEDHIPFFVRPPRSNGARGKRTADIAFLAPTASYMAYANDANSFSSPGAQMVAGRLVVLQPNDLHLMVHPEYCASLYDNHVDGSGICYSSRLRPILNLRPKYASWLGAKGSGLWQFNADLHLTDWLERKGFAYDVITDEDLHEEGFDLLKGYRVVLTGSHPEYYSTRMLDAVTRYTQEGGRLMYLGANGFYWRIAWHESLPGVIEVRRAEDGIRTWAAEPGEYFHSFSGEYGGLWRRQGRPPNLLVGTGFTAQGFDLSSYYRRLPGSFDPRAKFIFEGVGDDELIGDFGLVGGGAAGLELDRADPLLGTPPHALVLASSEKHTDIYMVVCEEILVNTPDLTGSQSPLVRADLVFFETPKGGGVFSVSSIAWMGSLSHNDYDNNVSRITENVLRRFVDPQPL
jgi:N,N-dimethylformamidase